MACCLCLRDNYNIMNVFSEKGYELNISNIIRQHFGIDCDENEAFSSQICNLCWQKVANFHVFHTKVKEIHQKNSGNTTPFNNSIDIYYNNDKKRTDANTIEISSDDNNDTDEDKKPLRITMDLETASQCDSTKQHSKGKINNLPSVTDACIKNERKSDLSKHQYSELSAHNLNNELSSSIQYISSNIANRRDTKNRPVSKLIKIENDEESSDHNDNESLLNEEEIHIKEEPDDHLLEPLHSRNYSDDSSEELNDILSGDEDNIENAEVTSQECRILDENKLIAQYIKLDCELCSYKCTKLVDLCKHYRDSHNIRGYVKCCEKKLYNRAFILDHIKLHVNPEAYTCSECHKVFGSSYVLKKHVKSKHGEPIITKFKYKSPLESSINKKELILKYIKIQCDMCATSCPEFDELRKHYLKDHKTRAYVRCCDKKLFDVSMMFDHVQIHIDPNIYSCPHCIKVFDSRYALKRHFEYKHRSILAKGLKYENIFEIPIYKNVFDKFGLKQEADEKILIENELISKYIKLDCEVCDAKYNMFYDLCKHYATKHRVKGYVKCCGKKLYNRSSMIDHVQVHVDPEIYTCPYCRKIFKSNYAMKKHQEYMHGRTASKKYTYEVPSENDKDGITQYINLVCEVCNVKFDEVTDFLQHMPTSHQKEGFLICCGEKLNSRSEIFNHLKIHLDPELYSCKNCQRIFNLKYALIRHMNSSDCMQTEDIDQPDEKYQFDDSSELSTSQHSFNANELNRSIESESTFVCFDCKNTYISKAALRLHYNICHKKPLGRLCHVCGDFVRGTSAYEKHINEHSKKLGDEIVDNPKCLICEKLFTSLTYLKYHIKSVHAILKPYKCKICGRTNKNRSKFNKHLKQHEIEKKTEVDVQSESEGDQVLDSSIIPDGNIDIKLESFIIPKEENEIIDC